MAQTEKPVVFIDASVETENERNKTPPIDGDTNKAEADINTETNAPDTNKPDESTDIKELEFDQETEKKANITPPIDGDHDVPSECTQITNKAEDDLIGTKQHKTPSIKQKPTNINTANKPDTNKPDPDDFSGPPYTKQRVDNEHENNHDTTPQKLDTTGWRISDNDSDYGDESTDTKELEPQSEYKQHELDVSEDNTITAAQSDSELITETVTKQHGSDTDNLEVEFIQFNFSEWITQNGLQSIRAILTRHKATSLSTLNISCKEFQAVMTDPQLFRKPEMIPKVLTAVHCISALIKVIVSEQEQGVIDKVQENIKWLHNAAKLQAEFAKSVEKIQEQKIKKKRDAKIKINATYDALIASLNTERRSVLHQVDGIADEKNEIGNNAVSELTKHIRNSSTFLREKEKMYDRLTSNNENRSDRKCKIMEMGNDVNCQFTETQNMLNKCAKIITHEIDKNDKVIFDIDFVVKPNKFAKILKYITLFAAVKNKRYESMQSRNDHNMHGHESEDEEVLIKRLENQRQEQNNQYKELQSELENIERELQAKHKQYAALQEQLESEKRKYVNICDARQQIVKDLDAKKTEYVRVCKELQTETIKCTQVFYEKQQIIKHAEKLETTLKREKGDRIKEMKEKEAICKDVKQKFERDLAIKNKQCQSFEKELQHEKTKYFNEFNQKQRIIADLKETSNRCQEIQKKFALQSTNVMQLTNFINELSNNEKTIFFTLTKHLTLNGNDKYRWFKCEEWDEKTEQTNTDILECVLIIKENPIWVKFIKSGEIKKNVVRNMLFLAPNIDHKSLRYIGEYHERLLNLNAFKLAMLGSGEWNVVSASHEIERAKILSSKQRTNAFWSGCNDFPQWFVIEAKAPNLIRNFEWKNYHDDEDTIKDFRLQVSNQVHTYHHDNDNDNDGWIDVQSYTSAKSAEWQVFHVTIADNVARSRYWRFYVENSYGGYARLDYLKLKFVG